jgi:hypothetical protein
MRKLLQSQKLAIVLLTLSPLLLIWQGLDVTDQGYQLANFQKFFSGDYHPDLTLMWLTYYIGGIWEILFGKLGVIGYRILWVITVWLCLVGVYQILRQHTQKNHILWLLLIPVLVIPAFTQGIWFDYNILTSLAYIWGIWALLLGCNRNQRFYFFIGGLIIGASFFARISNVVAPGLVILIFANGVLKRHSIYDTAKSTFFFLGGVTSGIVAILINIEFLGHRQHFLNGLIYYIEASLFDSTFHHSSSSLFQLLISDHANVIKITIPVLLGLSITAKIATKYFQHQLQFLWSISIFVIAISMAYVFYIRGYWWEFLPGWLYMAFLLSFYKGYKKIDNNQVLLSLAAFMMLFLLPLGSNVGIKMAFQSMYFTLPAALLFFIQNDIIIFKKQWLSKKTSWYIAFTITIAVTITALFNILSGQNVYRDTPDRIALTHTINHPKLRGIYTTQERAQVMQELLSQLENSKSTRQHLLLATQNIPLIYYITQTKPYLGHPWAILSPEPPSILLTKARKKYKQLPTVLLTKGFTRYKNWSSLESIQAGKSLRATPHNQQILAFIKENNYKVTWENSFFQILEPPRY